MLLFLSLWFRHIFCDYTAAFHGMNLNPAPNISANSTEKYPCISDPDELRALLSLASDGDTITICDGDYTSWKIQVDASGLKLEAETSGRATFHGGSFFDLRGDRNTLAGIVIHGGGSTTPVQVSPLVGLILFRSMAMAMYLRTR